MSKKLEMLKTNRAMIHEIVARNKGLSISIFGSIARGEDTELSDFDFLVEFASDTSFFDQFQMQEELANFLKSKVDVISLNSLKPRDADIRQEAMAL